MPCSIKQFKSYIKRIFGCECEEEKSEHEITIGKHLGGKRNKLSTTKYTVHNFFFKFLFERFQEPSNLFFLFLTLIQTIPGISPFGWHSTGGPLTAILIVSAFTEFYADVKRRLIDRKVNNSLVEAFDETTGEWKNIKWSKLQEGQLIRLEKNDRVPADVLLISSSEPGGVAYIETSNLDGEANLKIRQSLPHTNGIGNKEAVEKFIESTVVIQSEPPNRNIDEYNGRMHIPILTVDRTQSERSIKRYSKDDLHDIEVAHRTHGTVTVPLTVNQLILRGATVKNTEWLFAVVIYAGKHTKLMLNSIRKATKTSEVHRLTNHMVLTQIGWLLLITITATVMQKCAKPSFLKYVIGSGDLPSVSLLFVGELMLFASLVPISLFVTIEGCLMFQAYYLAQDLELYDEKRDMRVEVRSFGLIPNLGKIKYVMSDKTGTLTTNCMRFKFCSVNGVKYGKRNNKMEFDPRVMIKDLKTDRKGNSRDIDHFLIACSVCHTVVPETRHNVEDGKGQSDTVLHASSPDEATLVRFAELAAYSFKSRSPNSITVEVFSKKVTYRILAVIEFSSARKRMGIVVRCPSGTVRLYMKGADSIILPRLHAGTNPILRRVTLGHLKEFANNGYRTLVFAYREMPEKEYEEWAKEWNWASCQMEKRQEHMERVAEKIEKELFLIGASAIEDKLQERVPQTIGRLLQADIRVWVLTGDKLETAVNIGHSCNLLAPRVPILTLASCTEEDARTDLDRYIEGLGMRRLERRDQQLALIVDAKCLDFLLNSRDLRMDFLRLALCCSAVICCRCTPIQKAAVTRLIRKSVDGGVLAIGDGANDVAMIQEADVGVGIAGVEGMQASHSADFSITQFRHLDRLLLVHGAASYHRTTLVIMFSLYKNIVESFMMFLFAFHNGYSDNGIADEFTIVRYNMFFTSIIVGVMGIHETPAPLRVLGEFPKLYTHFHDKITLKTHLLWAGNAVFHAFVIFNTLLIYWGDGGGYSHGRDTWLQMFGALAYWCMTIVVNFKALLESRSIHAMTLFAFFGSIAWFLFSLAIDSFAFPYVQLPVLAPDRAHSLGMIYNLPSFTNFLLVIYIVVACLLPDTVAKCLHRTLAPSLLQRVIQSCKTRADIFDIVIAQPFVKICDIVGLKDTMEAIKYGYMFAQDDGRVVSQADLLKMYEGDDMGQSVLETAGIFTPHTEGTQMDGLPQDNTPSRNTTSSLPSPMSSGEPVKIGRTAIRLNEAKDEIEETTAQSSRGYNSLMQTKNDNLLF